MNNRICYLDNLKVALILLVIFHHVALPYIHFAIWPYTPSNPDELMPDIWRFMVVNAGFFMSLFFFISGYFLPSTYDRQGVELFVKRKLTRLGIPFLISGIIVCAILGKREFGPMWFVEDLLVLCLLYALFRQFVNPFTLSKRININLLSMLILASCIGIGSQIVRHFCPQDYWVFVLGFIEIEPAHSVQYISMFVLGLLAGRNGWMEKISTTAGVVSVILGIALVAGFALQDKCSYITRFIGIYESFLCVFVCLGLLWLFRRFCNVNHPFLSWLSAQSYGVYIIHEPVLLALEYLTDGIWIPAIYKFFIVGILTSVFSFYITCLLRRIPAVKKVL